MCGERVCVGGGCMWEEGVCGRRVCVRRGCVGGGYVWEEGVCGRRVCVGRGCVWEEGMHHIAYTYVVS